MADKHTRVALGQHLLAADGDLEARRCCSGRTDQDRYQAMAERAQADAAEGPADAPATLEPCTVAEPLAADAGSEEPTVPYTFYTSVTQYSTQLYQC